MRGLSIMGLHHKKSLTERCLRAIDFFKRNIGVHPFSRMHLSLTFNLREMFDNSRD